MAVSRRGKRGSRRVVSRPASRNKRVLRNALNKRITRQDDERPISNRKSKEQWVIECVTRVVGGRGGANFVAADDVASDIILALLDAGGFNWEEDEIIHFCRKRSMYMLAEYHGRRERSECEFANADGESVPVLELNRHVVADQDTHVDASLAAERLSRIPNKQREALEILCDGGNPIDVAQELKVKPWEAIALIREGREYVDRV